MLWIWLLVVIGAFIIEAVTTDLVSIWFGVGGLVAMVGCYFGFSQAFQIALFVAISIICIIVSRPLAKKYLKTNTVKTNFDRVIGQHGLVLKTINEDTKGEVKVLSTIWSASTFDNSTLEEGNKCEVLAVEGNHLIVKKI